MPKEPPITLKVNVKIAHRRWLPGSNGKGHYGPWKIQEVHNLLTTAGRDFLHQQGYETTGLGTNGGNYIALSTNSSGAAAGHTSVAGEISSDGLERAQGAVSHSAGTTTTTVIKTFTATGTHTAVQLCGLLTASSSGTLVHEATFTAVTLTSNDQLMITWTLTLS